MKQRIIHLRNTAQSNPGSIFLIILLILLAAAAPVWSYSQNWGFSPFSTIGLTSTTLMLLLAFKQV